MIITRLKIKSMTFRQKFRFFASRDKHKIKFNHMRESFLMHNFSNEIKRKNATEFLEVYPSQSPRK